MNRKMYWGLVIFIILLMDLACVLFLLYKHGPHEAFEAFEAFFRYQFIREGTSYQLEAEAYFLEIGGKDPPSEFMDRFSGHSPPTKNGSEFVSDDFENSDDLLFKIESWKWIGWGWLTRDHAEICGGYEDNFSGYYATYILKRDKKGWTLDRVGPIFHWDGMRLRMPPKP